MPQEREAAMTVTTPSIATLADVAVARLDEYCSPATNYAWPAYDIDELPKQLTATDLLASSMLSYPLRGDIVAKLTGGADDEYVTLRQRLQAVIAVPQDTIIPFERLTADDLFDRHTPGWGAVLDALTAAQDCSQLTSVAVTKILHRKRPDLVPIVDRRVRAFYGTGSSYMPLFEAVRADLAAHRDLVRGWADQYHVPDGRPMSLLRALDIVIWMGGERQPGSAG